MKKLLVFGAFVLAGSILAFNNKFQSFRTIASAPETKLEAAGTTFKADTASSEVAWTGYKIVGKHDGFFKLNEGTAIVDKGKVVSGNFVFNMSSLTVTDPASGPGKTRLENHLKSKDFFEVETFPIGKFEITGIEKYVAKEGASAIEGANTLVSGNLTLRGITKNISFPALVVITKDQVSAKANFSIDRSKWEMFYRSESSFGDNMIKNLVDIRLNFSAKP